MGIPPLMRSVASLAALLALSVASSASAESRPTEGGLWSFDDADVVESWDEETGQVRAHFSVEGPNRTLLADEDGDAVPDFPQQVARTTADGLRVFRELGFRAPVRESEVGRPLAGSDAYDIYLVDFGGAADGRFGIDACTGSPRHCAGFLVIENDFFGYSYPTLETAVDTVAVHEAFHAVQAAYTDLPIWLSEGSATWAERAYDESSTDFLRACNGYLADHTRPLYQPPPGPVPAFAYGTALWVDFLARRFEPAVIDDVLLAVEAAPGDAVESVMADVIGRGGAFELAWADFVRHNLATGARAGAATSHPYAGSLDAIEPDGEGSGFDGDVRLFPMAAEYWRLDVQDGPLYVGADAGLDGVVFSLHPVAGFAADGAVGDPIDVWDQPTDGGRALFAGDPLPAGGYWVVAANTTVGGESAQARVCIGSFDEVSACTGVDEGGDTEASSSSGDEPEATTHGDSSGGGSSSGAATGEPGSRGSSDDPAETGADTEGHPASERSGGDGCSCKATRTGSGGPVGLLLILAASWIKRRR